MNKCFIVSILACLISIESFASVYTGVNLGISTVTTKKDLIYPLEIDQPRAAHFSNAYTNFHGQLLLGYDLPLTAKLAMGFEADADFFTGKSRYTINNWYFNEGISAEEQLEYGFAFFALPSYHYNDSVRFFAGPGISTNRFAIKTNNSAGNIGVSGNYTKWLTGGGLKIGSITKLNNTVDLVLSYQFMQYGSITKTSVEPITEDSLRGSYKPYANTVLIGFRAHFPEVASK